MDESVSEFELIANFFARPTAERAGVGDDCALIDVGDSTLAITTDMLIEGRHFFSDVAPAALGHKALAVNLSDLAAAGAKPRCFLLSLALPFVDTDWLGEFSKGLFALADRCGCSLVGGDTVRMPMVNQTPGPFTISITAFGEVARSAIRTRAGARGGDDIWVSGNLGAAALFLINRSGGLRMTAADIAACKLALEQPEPRVPLGLQLRGLASASIDISDGLLGDLQHILDRSNVAARVYWESIPLHPALAHQVESTQLQCALAGGDDYELLFTAAREHRAAIADAGAACATAVTRIGECIEGAGYEMLDADGAAMTITVRSFDHFA